MQFLLIICCMAGLIAGCKTKSSKTDTKPDEAPAVQAPIVTPATASRGKVSWLNKEGRFVIVTFPFGHVPKADQRLNVYRAGLKVGELKVTGPQREENTVADITTGEAQLNDEVREN
jgi:hypothetical protein